MTVVLGVDPGGSSVGIVLTDGRTLVDWRLIERDGEPLDRWCNRAVNVAGSLVGAVRLDLVAVEGLNPPSPHMGMTSVSGLIDTAAVIGALVGWAGEPAFDVDLQLVPPNRHGRAAEGLGRVGLLAAYPEPLVGPQETKGTGRMRHVRAAWDVAQTALREQQHLDLGGAA